MRRRLSLGCSVLIGIYMTFLMFIVEKSSIIEDDGNANVGESSPFVDGFVLDYDGDTESSRQLHGFKNPRVSEEVLQHKDNKLTFQPFDMEKDKYRRMPLEKLPNGDLSNFYCKGSTCIHPERDSVTLVDNTNVDISAQKVFHMHPQDITEFETESGNFQQFMINTSLSEKLPFVRNIEYKGPHGCPTNTDNQKELLPKVSIIIPFHNEAWSVFLRTIHGLLHFTSIDLIHEIIFVDDSSETINMKERIPHYLKNMPKIKLLRTHKREGLIRARMLGAKVAQADVLVFLDAHMEFSKNWLEPLLGELRNKPKTIAVPRVRYINPQTLGQYLHEDFLYGTFSWELDFMWKDIPVSIANESTVEPFPTQTIIGCAFAVSRYYFFYLGGFDESMHIWGGENLEISFRTWMCGGSVNIVPCSNVWHIFRSTLPYSFPEQDVIHKNLQKLAMVWMDKYKKYYYLTTGKVLHLDQSEKDAISDRQALRQRLQCQSFSAFLSRTSNDLMNIPNDATLFGQMKNVGVSSCLKISESEGQQILVFDPCTVLTKDQTFMYIKKQLVHVQSNLCLTMGGSDEGHPKVILDYCSPADHLQRWSFNPIVPAEIEQSLSGLDTRRPVGTFMLRYGDFSMCLAVKESMTGTYNVIVQKCVHDKIYHFWVFTHKIYDQLKPKLKELGLY